MVTLLGGAASGAVTLLAVATVMNAGKPGTLGGRAIAGGVGGRHGGGDALHRTGAA